MPNIAAVLKDEIRRLAKREIKAATSTTKQAVVQYRHDIAKLKQLVQGQQKEIAFLKAQERRRLGQPLTQDQEELEGVRHSARSVQAQRKRLGLSATDFGKLIGVSGLTVYNWEHGKGRPKKERLAALVAVRKLGKREATAKLELL
jgi:DNA-binding transcriptional regulator YiaG